MFQKNHVGALTETVKLNFNNGYAITLEAGVEMAMSLTMTEDSNGEVVRVPVAPTPPPSTEAAELRAALDKLVTEVEIYRNIAMCNGENIYIADPLSARAVLQKWPGAK